MLLQQRNNETQHQITGIFEEFKKNKEFPVATSLLLARMLYVPDWRLPPVEQSREILRKYFELNDFRNPVFQRSPFFAQKITDYLSIASMQSETTKDSVLIASVDQFFLTLSASDTLLTDITAIMRKWLLQNGYDAVCEYLDVRYLSAQCTAGNDINLQERLEAYRRTAKGQTAPEIYWINGNGEHGKLSGLTGKNVTVVFWATWCQHCMETLPAIYKYTLQKMIPVIAIAIDQVEEPWGKAIGALPGWIHLRASGGWNDPWIKLYGVYGTPTIFVLDADKKIVGKVSNLDDLISLTR
jgi:thiol-disulfide isomerase/thioredoxin